MEFNRINNNPGLLPVKIGNMQNAIDKWTIIRIINIKPLLDGCDQMFELSTKLNSSLESLAAQDKYQIRAYHKMLHYELIETKKIISQIIPFSQRKKRGLFDGLGSVIKFFTGNMDKNDQDRYDTAINQLISNQDKLKTVIDTQISLAERAIKNYNDTVNTLTTNQDKLKKRVEYLSQVISDIKHNSDNLNLITITQFTILQLITEVAYLKNILETLVNAITFARLATMHPSILEPTDFIHELTKISTYDVNLPYETNIDNLALYEETVTIKCYYKEFQLHFIIEVPLVEHKIYNYYHLYAFPMNLYPKLTTYTVIIPQAKYLALNDENYSLNDEVCQEVKSATYLCRDQVSNQISPSSPCEVQLARFTRKYEKCERNQVNLQKTKIQKVSHNQWIVISPNESVVQYQCKDNANTAAIKGSYLVKIPQSCQLKINKYMLSSHQSDIKMVYHIEVPEIPIDNINSEEQLDLSPIQLESVNLDEMKNIKTQLKHQRRIVEEIQLPNIHTSTSVWTIILYIISAMLILCFSIWRVKLYWDGKLASKERRTEVPLESIHMRN